MISYGCEESSEMMLLMLHCMWQAACCYFIVPKAVIYYLFLYFCNNLIFIVTQMFCFNCNRFLLKRIVMGFGFLIIQSDIASKQQMHLVLPPKYFIFCFYGNSRHSYWDVLEATNLEVSLFIMSIEVITCITVCIIVCSLFLVTFVLIGT
jgi:hypothetical protein